jgi:hypothetical protein
MEVNLAIRLSSVGIRDSQTKGKALCLQGEEEGDPFWKQPEARE